MKSTPYSSVRSIGGVILTASSLAADAEVGQLLGAGGVDDEVVVAAVDADDHAFVDRVASLDEHAPRSSSLPSA